MALFFHSTARLVTAEYACTCLIFTSFIDVPSLVCVDPKYFNWSTYANTFSFVHKLVDGLDLIL